MTVQSLRGFYSIMILTSRFESKSKLALWMSCLLEIRVSSDVNVMVSERASSRAARTIKNVTKCIDDG